MPQHLCSNARLHSSSTLFSNGLFFILKKNSFRNRVMIPPRSIAANVLCCPRGGDITCIHVLPRFNCELVCRYLEANGRLNVSFNFSFLRGGKWHCSRDIYSFLIFYCTLLSPSVCLHSGAVRPSPQNRWGVPLLSSSHKSATATELTKMIRNLMLLIK